MPALLSISRKYNMSKDMTGIIVAMGNLIPDITTTVQSFMRHGVKMTEFGIACNIGVSVFVITVVPAIVVLLTQTSTNAETERLAAVQNKKYVPRHEAQLKFGEAMQNQNHLRQSFFRDLSFFILSLLMYNLFLQSGIIYFNQVMVLFGLLAVYVSIVILTNLNHSRKLSALKQSALAEKEEEEEQVLIADSPSKASSQPGELPHYGAVQEEKQEGEPSSHESNGALSFLEKLCFPILKPLEWILPLEKAPELVFAIIVVIFFIAIDFILTVVGVASVYTSLSHMLIGLTLMSWGSAPIETINLMIATKKNEMQIGLTSILSGIVLSFYLLIPLAMVFKMNSHSASAIEILQPIHSSNGIFIPPLLVALVVLATYYKSDMALGKSGCVVLIVTYLAYLFYMTIFLFGEKV